MGHTSMKFGGRGFSGRHEGQRRVNTTQNEKEEERKKIQKTNKNRKKSAEKTKSKKTKIFLAHGRSLTRPPGLPGRSQSPPFEPNKRPDSGFS